MWRRPKFVEHRLLERCSAWNDSFRIRFYLKIYNVYGPIIRKMANGQTQKLFIQFIRKLVGMSHTVWQCSSWELIAMWKPYVFMSNFHKMNYFAYVLMDCFISIFKLAYERLYGWMFLSSKSVKIRLLILLKIPIFVGCKNVHLWSRPIRNSTWDAKKASKPQKIKMINPMTKI